MKAGAQACAPPRRMARADGSAGARDGLAWHGADRVVEDGGMLAQEREDGKEYIPERPASRDYKSAASKSSSRNTPFSNRSWRSSCNLIERSSA